MLSCNMILQVCLFIVCLFVCLFVCQKLAQRAGGEPVEQSQSELSGEKPVQQPYRRMLPGMKLKQDGEGGGGEGGEGVRRGVEGEEEGKEEEEEDDGVTPSLPTPRKRLMNFKIPLIDRGGKRRDQGFSSIVARRKLFSDGGESWLSFVATQDGLVWQPLYTLICCSRSCADKGTAPYSDISSDEAFSSEAEEEEEEEEGEGGGSDEEGGSWVESPAAESSSRWEIVYPKTMYYRKAFRSSFFMHS